MNHSFHVLVLDMPDRPATPFDSIEGAHEYIRLLGEAVEDAQKSITQDLAEPAATKGAERRVDALRAAS